MMRRAIIRIGILGWLAALAGCAQERSAPYGLELEACAIEGVDVAVECGRIFVFENRAARSGRKIPIEFFRVRATGADPAPEPIFALTGGPGEIALDRAAPAINAATTLENRDLILLDQRGTGRSNGLDCVNYDLEARPEAFEEMFEKPFFDADRFRACKDRLATFADLRFYTTSLVADDINDLRTALGYDQIILGGSSYGTTLALETIRRHGAHIKGAALSGVVPPSVNQTETLAADMEMMLERLFEDCESDTACNGAFPAFRSDFHEVLDHVRREPVEVTLPHSLTGEPTKVHVRYPELAIAVRYALYSTGVSAGVPLAVAKAKAGDYSKLTALLPQLLYRLAGLASEGMWASVRCAEEFPYLDDDRARALAEGTVLGAERIDSGEAICSFWPRGEASPTFHDPVQSDVPVLMIAGEIDAATPPWMAEEAARHLANGRLIIVPMSSHWELRNGCIDGIVAQFLEAGSAADLDTACLSGIKRPPFELQ